MSVVVRKWSDLAAVVVIVEMLSMKRQSAAAKGDVSAVQDASCMECQMRTLVAGSVFHVHISLSNSRTNYLLTTLSFPIFSRKVQTLKLKISHVLQQVDSPRLL